MNWKALLGGLLSVSAVEGDVLEAGRVLPDVELVRDGELVKLRDQVKGKALVHVFASW